MTFTQLEEVVYEFTYHVLHGLYNFSFLAQVAQVWTQCNNPNIDETILAHIRENENCYFLIFQNFNFLGIF